MAYTLLQASGDSYSFLEKALHHYRTQDSAALDLSIPTRWLEVLQAVSPDNTSLDTAYTITLKMASC